MTEYFVKSLRVRKLVYLIPILFLAISALYFREWVRIGLMQDQTAIEAYHFGSEPMVGAGGWAYLSAEAYAASGLLNGTVIFLSTVMFAIGVNKKIKLLWVIACVPFTAYVFKWIWFFFHPPNI